MTEQTLAEARQALADADFTETDKVPAPVLRDVLALAYEAILLIRAYDREKLLVWKKRRKEFLAR